MLNHFLGQTRLLAQLGGAGAGFAVQSHERRLVRAKRQHLLGFAHYSDEIAILLAVVDRDASVLAVQKQLHTREPALHLTDAGDGADGIKDIGSDALDVLALRDCEDQPLGRGERGLDCAQSGRPPGADWRGDAREENDLPKGKYRQSEAFSHLNYCSSRSPLAGLE